MKVLIASNSFKGSLNSKEVNVAINNGIKTIDPTIKTYMYEIADGGEGTIISLSKNKKIKYITKKVHGPNNKLINAKYAFIKKENLVIIETSKIIGLTLLKNNELNPLYLTTLGIGEIISDALNKNINNFIIALGGSATNDGGVGMLSALGYKFLDKNNKPIKLGAIGLKDLNKIDITSRNKKLNNANFLLMVDVNNPLLGKNGCSYIYGPQKGANTSQIIQMDKWLGNYAKLTREIIKVDIKNEFGVGSAGGLGFAFKSFLNAKIKYGIDVVIKNYKLENIIKNVDLIITGEGKIDNQTINGKAPIGIAKLAKKYNKPVIAFSGFIDETSKINNKYGIDAYFSINNKPLTLNVAKNKKNAKTNLKNTVEQIFRLILKIKK